MHLAEHAPTRRRGLFEKLQVVAPDVRRVLAAKDAKGDGAPRLHGQLAEPAVIVLESGIARVAIHALARDLEDTRVHLAHHADEPSHFVPRRHPARHGAAIGRLVARRARSGEAHGSSGERAPELSLHRLEIVLRRRLVEGALPHDVGTERGVPHVAGVVDALGQRLEGVKELGVGGPAPLDARLHRLRGDVLGPLEIADHQGAVRLGAGCESEAAVTHHDASDAVPAGGGPERIPEDLGVHVGMAVNEARGDDATFGVDDLAGRLTDAANGGDAPLFDADVGAIPRQSRAVHHPAVFDHEVKGHPTILPVLEPGAPQPFEVSLWYPTRRRTQGVRIRALTCPVRCASTPWAPTWTSGSSTTWSGGTCRSTSSTRCGCACCSATTRPGSTRIIWPSITPRRSGSPLCPASSLPRRRSARTASASARACIACRCTTRCGSSRKSACSITFRAGASTSGSGAASWRMRWPTSTCTTSRRKRSTRKRSR